MEPDKNDSATDSGETKTESTSEHEQKNTEEENEDVDLSAQIKELREDLGRTKRELKKATKSELSSSKKETDTGLLEELNTLKLSVSGIKEKDEVELARKWQERTGMKMDEILSDDIFQAKLQSLRDNKAAQVATDSVKGGGEGSQGKSEVSYWLAKGMPPKNVEEVGGRANYAKIIRAFAEKAQTSGKTFYND